MQAKKSLFVALVLLLTCGIAFADGPAPDSAAPNSTAVTVNQVVDRFIAQEAALVQAMRKYHPVVETYFQSTRPDAELGSVPDGDKYFLGRLDMSDGVQERFYTAEVETGLFKKLTTPIRQIYSMDFSPLGFSSMVFLDRGRFDRNHYYFKFLRREFLGQVRTYVFEVVPKDNAGAGLFLGRIWVEDQGFNIVRFNGTYTKAPKWAYYFHMDSWRTNIQPGLWLPSHVYSEESDFKYASLPVKRTLRYKAQTRLWGYDLKSAGRQEEFTDMVIDSGNVKDQAAEQQDVSPVLSNRTWQREAEENVIDRLEKAGLLARAGEVDKVLETVANNIEITNNLDIQPEIRCRVLLTTPLESFTIGHTIVVSRGLLDVLPDEPSLAMVLAHEIAHIALGHQIETKYAFADRMWIADEDSFDNFRFRSDAKSEAEADAKAIELLKNSPYKDKLGSIGLFLRTLQLRAAAMPNLIKPRMGDGLASGDKVTRMAELMNGAPEVDMRKLDQISALPLGGRIRLDPWDDHVELIKAQPVPLLSAKEKMPFEVTPVIPNLKRFNAPDGKLAATTPGNPGN
jgi:hypothetical protein